MLLPLDCHTAETGELVNGGRSPFILTVDMGDRLCYLMQNSPLTIFGISKGKFQPRKKKFFYLLGHLMKKSKAQKSVSTWLELFLKKNSVQLGQNFQKLLPDNLSGIKKRPPTNLGGSQKSYF